MSGNGARKASREAALGEPLKNTPSAARCGSPVLPRCDTMMSVFAVSSKQVVHPANSPLVDASVGGRSVAKRLSSFLALPHVRRTIRTRRDIVRNSKCSKPKGVLMKTVNRYLAVVSLALVVGQTPNPKSQTNQFTLAPIPA